MQLDDEESDPREIASRPVQAGYKSKLDGVAPYPEDDRNYRGRRFCCKGRRSAAGRGNHVHPTIDQIGISNASLSDAQTVGKLVGSAFEYVQNEYNLLASSDAERLIPYCAEQGLRYVAFSPLAGGLLTGKYRLGEAPPAGSRLAHAPEIGAAL